MSWLDRLFLFGRKRITDSGALAQLIWATAHSTATDIAVTPRTALESPTTYRCISFFAAQVAHLPLILFERLDGGSRRPAVGHPLYRVLKEQPNPWTTSIELRTEMVWDYWLYGIAIAQVVRVGRDGRVRELHRIHPERASIEIADDGAPTWVVRDDGVGTRRFGPGDVLVIRAPSSDGLRSRAPIQFMREAIALEIALDRYAGFLFRRGALPSAVLESDRTLSEEAIERLRKSWEGAFTGLDNAHKTPILEGGLKYRPISLDAEKAQLVQARQHVRTVIAAGFGVPPHKVGDLAGAIKSNIEQQAIEWVTDAIAPHARLWEQAISRDLLTDEERVRLFVEHRLQGLLRGDAATRSSFYHNAILDGWMTRNEVRALENLNPIDGLDEPLRPVNMEVVDGRN